MEKNLVQSFCGALISSHEVIKLQSFESGASDVIPANVQIFHPWFSLHIFLNFMEKELFTQFYGCFDRFS